jgi:hypothetical protein
VDGELARGEHGASGDLGGDGFRVDGLEAAVAHCNVTSSVSPFSD